MKPAGLARRLEALLARHWWRAQPSLLVRALWPPTCIYRWLSRRHAARQEVLALSQTLGVPVLVVGNIVVGGAGKTPTVVAIALALKAAGHRPGIISRGHGRRGTRARRVSPGDDAAAAGDEPLLIQRLTRMPVWVGADRTAAARALCAENPKVDVLVSDDGLQHRALARQAELIVFDARGVGNGRLLPAGPLREPVPGRLGPRQRVLYTAGVASTALPGGLATPRLAGAWPLAAWHRAEATQKVPLSSLRDRDLWAAAGLAAPEKFFAMLEREGLGFHRLPLPDHHDYAELPWPPGAADVLVTEKDAVKLNPDTLGTTRVWVVPLDLQLPDALVPDLLGLLFPDPALSTRHSTALPSALSPTVPASSPSAAP